MRFENTDVWGFEHAIRGMRNPMNSWDKSDSFYGCANGSNHKKDNTNCDECLYDIECNNFHNELIIGENDMKLMQKLIRAGSEHRKFMRQIFVSVDITAPLYFFKEIDTYKVGTVANSTSTMHKLSTTPITMGCFETDDYIHLDDRVSIIINMCEDLRQRYLQTKDKRYWKELVRWLPESWSQTRTLTMNYENIFNMVNQRKNHKLNEWSGIDNPNVVNFIGWAKTLPYAKELIFINETS